MGSHQNSSHGVIVPKIVRLSGTDNYEFFYKMDDENNVELYVLVKEKYVRVCVINKTFLLHLASPTPKLIVVVDFPTPPFWFANAIVFICNLLCLQLKKDCNIFTIA